MSELIQVWATRRTQITMERLNSTLGEILRCQETLEQNINQTQIIMNCIEEVNLQLKAKDP